VKTSIALSIILAAGSAQAETEEQQAVQEISRAVELYHRGEYRAAAESFLLAHRLSERPVQLRNAARAYEEGDMLDEARELWIRYADQQGLSRADRDEAAAHVRLIDMQREAKRSELLAEAAQRRMRLANRALAEAKDAADAREVEVARLQQTLVQVEREHRLELDTHALITAIGGGAIAAASATLYAFSVVHANDLESRLGERSADGRITGIDFAGAEREAARISDERYGALGLAIGAGAALVTSLILYLVDES